jgi:phosphopantothenoylcysteine decarboxylase/phosphopantothenate--cysteine ligase
MDAPSLQGRAIVVGVGGGIAAYKAVVLVRELQRLGAEVRVVMTPASTRFVGPITFAGITGRPPVVDLWDPTYAGEVHVELGAWADAVVIAPATMNLLARAAAGFADDTVLATVACARGPVFYAPAMHSRMWGRASTQRAVAELSRAGAFILGPVEGELASREHGEGRMLEPDALAQAVAAHLHGAETLAGTRILVTAGPTVEDIDPVRYLGNRSSGRMGYALASRAAARGATVTLVSGPVSLPAPRGVDVIAVRSALEMQAAVREHAPMSDAIIMAAAVADYRPRSTADHKLKKTDGPLQLELVRNPDILAELGAARESAGSGTPVLVGFAVETGDLVAYARDKLTRKKCDLVVANEASVAFGGDDNRATLVTATETEALPPMKKLALADQILDRIALRLATGD